MHHKHLFAFVAVLALCPCCSSVVPGRRQLRTGTAEVYRTGTRHDAS